MSHLTLCPAMASSSNSSAASGDHRHLHHGSTGLDEGIPAPPPPTPSNNSLSNSLAFDAEDALSCVLRRLLVTPALSPLTPSSRFVAKPGPSPPLISLLRPQRDLLLSAASGLGFFHLADHGIPSHLLDSALLESQSLLHSPTPPIPPSNHSALGFKDDDNDGDGDPAIVFDAAGDFHRLEAFPKLVECARGLEGVALEVVEMLSSVAGGFPENPFRTQRQRARCLMWVSMISSSSVSSSLEAGRRARGASKRYPYVVGLQYEVNRGDDLSWVANDSGARVPVACRAGSFLVTLGDIAQVWSNGRFKKVFGRPRPTSAPSDGRDGFGRMSLSLMLTLPLDSVISPLPPSVADGVNQCVANGVDKDDGDDDGRGKFCTFSLEEYARRIYYERPPSKDPLLEYRI